MDQNKGKVTKKNFMTITKCKRNLLCHQYLYVLLSSSGNGPGHPTNDPKYNCHTPSKEIYNYIIYWKENILIWEAKLQPLEAMDVNQSMLL